MLPPAWQPRVADSRLEDQAALARMASSAALIASGVPTCIQTPSRRRPQSRSASAARSNNGEIENAQARLNLSDADVAYSRGVLRQYGNLSSATVLFVLDAVLQSGRPQPGDIGLMVALGPGFAAEGALLRF